MPSLSRSPTAAETALPTSKESTGGVSSTPPLSGPIGPRSTSEEGVLLAPFFQLETTMSRCPSLSMSRLACTVNGRGVRIHASAVGAFGLALRTEDGGDTWERFQVGGDEDDLHLNELFEGSDGTRYIAAEVGTVYRSREAPIV